MHTPSQALPFSVAGFCPWGKVPTRCFLLPCSPACWARIGSAPPPPEPPTSKKGGGIGGEYSGPALAPSAGVSLAQDSESPHQELFVTLKPGKLNGDQLSPTPPWLPTWLTGLWGYEKALVGPFTALCSADLD